MKNGGHVEHVATVRVIFGDTDAAGIVFYPAPPGLSATPGKRYTEADGSDSGQFVPAGTKLIEYLLA